MVVKFCWLIAARVLILRNRTCDGNALLFPPDNCAKIIDAVFKSDRLQGFLCIFERLLPISAVSTFSLPLSSALNYKIGRRIRHHLFDNK